MKKLVVIHLTSLDSPKPIPFSKKGECWVSVSVPRRALCLLLACSLTRLASLLASPFVCAVFLPVGQQPKKGKYHDWVDSTSSSVRPDSTWKRCSKSYVPCLECLRKTSHESTLHKVTRCYTAKRGLQSPISLKEESR